MSAPTPHSDVTFFISFGQRRSQVSCQLPLSYADMLHAANAVFGLPEQHIRLQHVEESGEVRTDQTDADIIDYIQRCQQRGLDIQWTVTSTTGAAAPEEEERKSGGERWVLRDV